jgi:hypothetical protein
VKKKNSYIKEVIKVASSGGNPHEIFKQIESIRIKFLTEYPSFFTEGDRVCFRKGIGLKDLKGISLNEEMSIKFMDINNFIVKSIVGTHNCRYYGLITEETEEYFHFVVPEDFITIIK